MQIVLYSDDINLLTHWENAIEKPCKVVESLEEIFQFSNTLVVINYSACESKCTEVLSRLAQQKNRVLVLHRTPSFETAKELLGLGGYGYGNAMMRAHFIVAALQTIEEDMIWIYPEFTSQLILGITPKTTVHNDIMKVLSSREKEVALLLKEGKTYKEIGETLNITPRTIKAHAQQIYTKLHVKDRLALALLLR